MPTMNSSMPPWLMDYSFSVNPSVERSEERPSVQRRSSHRSIVVADVKRMLQGAELPYFEYFVREICNEGTSKFTDVYADGNGLVTGTIRIVGGRYNVSTDTRKHVVTCQIEIFR